MYLTRKKIELPVILSPPKADEGSRSFGAFSPSGRLGVPRNDCGASVFFLGIVRDHSEGRSVLFLEYEAYEEMAERMLREIVARAFSQWGIEEIKLVHRLGRVERGEIAVAIEVGSAHRDEAYGASRFLIEEIKHKVPIWKKEYFSDGASAWSGCEPRHCEGAQRPKQSTGWEIASSSRSAAGAAETPRKDCGSKEC